MARSWPGATHDDASNALFRVAASLEVLRHDCEDAGGKRHVKETVSLLAPALQILEVLVEGQEGLILVVLACDVRTEVAEVLERLLNILRRGLDVGLDSLQIFLVVHLGSRIADDFDVLWQELVAVLGRMLVASVNVSFRMDSALTRPNRAGNCTMLAF